MGLSRPIAWLTLRWRTILLALGSGAAPALAHPPFGIWPGLLGFGLLLHLLDQSDGAKPLRSAFWRGWLAGSVYFLICTWWVGEAFLVDVAAHGWQAPFAVGCLAGGLGLLWGAAGLTYRWMAPNHTGRIFVFAAVFAAFEWLRGHILSGFPWDLPGEAWRAGGLISQTASLIGVYGLSAITLGVAATGAVWLSHDGRRNRLVATATALVVLALLAGFGALTLNGRAPSSTGVRLRVVQANIDQEAKWTPESFRTIFETYTRLTAEPPKPGRAPPQVILWPEGAIPANAADYLAEGTWTRAALTDALRPGQILLMGAVRSDGAGPSARYYNSLLALRRDPAGLTTLGVYDKHHLVPFGEYMPMDSLMGAVGFKALVHVGDGFTAGPPPDALRLPGLPAVQPLICYESLFPALTPHDRPRPAWIANVSNDAWFGKTSGPWQHLNLGSYRAIEEGLPIIRATPTGVSAVIDSFGRPVATLGLGAQGVVDADLPGAANIPVYRYVGDGPFWLLLIVGFLGGGVRPAALFKNVTRRTT